MRPAGIYLIKRALDFEVHQGWDHTVISKTTTDGLSKCTKVVLNLFAPGCIFFSLQYQRANSET